MKKEQWLIPFKGRLSSGPELCNLLYKKQQIYIMDNHRLALWSWFQHLKLDSDFQYNFFHIDAHYDCDPAISEIKTDLANLSLEQYMNYPAANSNGCLFRWDNYLPVLLNQYKEKLNITYSATHNIGIKANFDHEFMPWDLLKYLENRFFDHKHWIVNLDLDYFFARENKDTPLFHPEYMKKIFRALKTAYDDQLIDVMTIALSPECCGGWDKAEIVLELLKQEFQIEMAL